MYPKPPFRKEKRQERRRVVTLIAGLVCDGGIVFAADSEESGIIKKSVAKVAHTESSLIKPLSGVPLCEIVVAGAGNGALCDYASQKIIACADFISTLEEAEEQITAALIEIYTVHVPLQIVRDPSEADFQLLIGVKPGKSMMPVLYSTHSAALVKRNRYFACGSGTLVDYLLDQTYEEGMPVEDGIAAVLSMLKTAKTYVAGVGGTSTIVTLTNKGLIEEKPNWEVREEENLAEAYAELSAKTLLATMRTRIGTDDDFKKSLSSFGQEVRLLRKRKQKSDKWMDEYMERLENRHKPSRS